MTTSSPAHCGPAVGMSPRLSASIRQTGFPSHCPFLADPTPNHCMTHGSLADTSDRRLDVSYAAKGPQPLFHFKDLEAGCSRLGAPPPRPISKGLLDLAPQSAHSSLKGRPCQSAVPDAVPVAKQTFRQRQQSLTDLLSITPAIDHGLKVATIRCDQQIWRQNGRCTRRRYNDRCRRPAGLGFPTRHWRLLWNDGRRW